MKHLMKTYTVVVLLGLTIATTAIAQPIQGGKINIVVQPEPPGLMLGIVQNGPAQLVAGNIYESLLRYNEDLSPRPSLAESWNVSDNGLTYTFNLRQGVKWHDGQAFSSADVVFSADVFLRETHPRFRVALSHVDTISAPDDHTVVFKLKNQFGPFLGVFESGTMPMVPKHIYEGSDFKSNPANATPIGTGAFKFAEWQKGSFIKLVRNEDYYEDGLPYLDEVYFQIIPDAAARSVAFESGNIDVLPGGSVENFDVPRLTKADNSCSTGRGWEYFAPHSFVWLNNAEGPTSDVRFRQAIMYALDREFARDVVWNGLGNVATGPISSQTRFYSADVVHYDYNPDRAKELLKEMGYDGTEVRLLPLPYGETWQRWAEAVKQNLQDVGIPVTIVATDVAGWNQKLAERDYDMGFTYLYQYGDPALGVARSYLSNNREKGSPWNNVEGYANTSVDDLFNRAASIVDEDERQNLYTQVQQQIVEDVPVAWMLELEFPTIYNCKVKDLVTSAIGINDGLRDAWLDQ